MNHLRVVFYWHYLFEINICYDSDKASVVKEE